jgi:hypothetical protein
MTRSQHILLIAAVASAVLGLTGCTVSPSPPPAGSFCVPRFTIEPSVVRAGDTISIASDAKCDVDLPREGWVVIASPVGSRDQGVRANVMDRFDGTFRVELVLSSDFPVGDAFAGIENWDYSQCADTGSCASASASFRVRP